MSSLELHPLCTFFPRMPEDDFKALIEDIRINGQIQPITLHDGMILDGGNRYRALCELGLNPVTTVYNGTNPVQFVLSANLRRRHLTQGQAAAIVAAAQDWSNAQTVGRPSINNHDEKMVTRVTISTVGERAKESGASERTQMRADKLVREAPKELVKQVTSGEKTLNKALKEIEPEDEKPEETEEPEPDLHEIIEDQQKFIAELTAHNATLEKAVNGAAEELILETVAVRAENQALRSQLGALQNERNEMLKRIKWLEKELKKFKPEADTTEYF